MLALAGGCDDAAPGASEPAAPAAAAARGEEAPPEPPEEAAGADGRGEDAGSATLASPEMSRVRLGAAHGCALGEDDRLRCWGSNRFGQLGRSNLARGPGAHAAEASPVPGLGAVAAVAAGAFHTCALGRSGRVRCFGHGGHGLLGETAAGGEEGGEDVPAPREVAGVDGATAVAAGEGFTCAVVHGGMVVCWGRNDHGQLGRGERGPPGAPAPVRGLDGVVGLAAGRQHACARRADGAVWCWGMTVDGQMGAAASGEVAAVPVRVGFPEPAVEVAAGGYHTCARFASGEVRCVGSNDSGQLGTGGGGAPEDRQRAPVAMNGVMDAASLAAGARFTCVRRRGGTVACAGYNGHGQLGDGTTTLRKRAVPVKGLRGATALAAGASHACAALAAGGVACWGRDADGRLGAGTESDRSAPPALAVPLDGSQ